MYLSVLSLSLIFATVLGFSLSLVSALSLISLLPCLPPNSPTPPLLLSCILTILTVQDYFNALQVFFTGTSSPRPVELNTGSGRSEAKLGGEIGLKMGRQMSGDASPPPAAPHLLSSTSSTCVSEANPTPSFLLLVSLKPLRL